MSTKNTQVSKPKKKKMCICTIKKTNQTKKKAKKKIKKKWQKKKQNKKQQQRQGVSNKPDIRYVVLTYPTRTVAGDPLLNFSFESK